jgi:Zn-dependent protease with chaperone function
MTSNKSKPTLFTGLLLLALACVSLVNLCSWIIHWCLDADFVKQTILIAALLTIGLLAVAWQLWRTSQYTRQLLSYAHISLPLHLESLIAEFGLDTAQVAFIQSPQPMAFCFGFLRPRICLSTSLVDLLSTPQLQAALLHEDYHRRRFDPLRILLVEAIGAALFFLPVVQEWRTLYKIKLELNADRYAVEKAGKAALAGALHRLLSYSAASMSFANVVTAGISANSARIAALLGERSAQQQISARSFVRSAAILWALCLLLML